MAKGAFAQVHRCALPVRGGPETCAVKVEDLPVEESDMRRLMDMYSEVSIVEQFHGRRCISQLYDFGVTHDSLYMVMKEYKCSLRDWRKKLPPKCPRAIRLFLRIFRNVVEAVKVLHESNVVHFDLKCSNVLLDPLPGVGESHFWSPPTEELPFRVVLADFGEARSYSNSWEARTVRNRGTEFNKSPEMLLISNANKKDQPEFDRRKRQGAGQPCDIWALGCLLFEIVSGEMLQYDDDWSRFFVRITRTSLPVVDGDRLRLLDDTKSLEIVLDLLKFMLVRDQSWRPSLSMVERRLDSLMASGSLPQYLRPFSKGSEEDSPPATVEQFPGIQLFGDMGELPLDIITITSHHVLARVSMVRDPWVLVENNITMIVLVRGGPPNAVTSAVRGAAARAQIELMEMDLLMGLMESDPLDADQRVQTEQQMVGKDHTNAVLERRSARVALAAEAGYEKPLLQLATAIVKEEECVGEFEAHLWIWRRLK